jgi:hypothetical protein
VQTTRREGLASWNSVDAAVAIAQDRRSVAVVPALEVAGLARAIDVAARLKQLVSVACFDDRQHLDEFVPELVDV